MTVWTTQQQAALDKARRWIDAPAGSVPQVFKLWGFAGTGKSTLAHELNAHVGGRALAAAYTGKAASVMARKGLPNATTVHRLIYSPSGNDGKKLLQELTDELRLIDEVKDPSRGLLDRRVAVERQLKEAKEKAGQPSFVLKPRQECDVPKAPLVILDEASMVPGRMGEDLLSFGTRVLVIGDPFQLPPVKGVGYFTDGRPDVLLTEIHRQARDSAIVALATDVREGRSIRLGDYGDARVVSRIGADEAVRFDQILCGTNSKRQAINRRHRQLGGHDGPMPRAGERLVCLKNDHTEGLLNGTIWTVQEDVEWETGQGDVHLRVQPEEGGVTTGFIAEASLFIDESQKPQWGSSQQFTYGYALTVHKSQGSQFDNVCVFDESACFKASSRNWLYTAITRAARDLTVVQT